ncbi:MAG: lytic transglycosylase domain-containing protein [Deltaproteobacteria bacterium]|nr:lytic transglycosylase domain-containing protein [Deltaproteobacteria bacterium]
MFRHAFRDTHPRYAVGALSLGAAVVALSLFVAPAASGLPLTDTEALREVPPQTARSVLAVSLPQVPSIAPGAPLLREDPDLSDLRHWMRGGRPHQALLTARALTERLPPGRQRDAVWLTVGLLERDEGHHNRASEAFTRVRAAGGPLASWGAWYEAEQDLARGRPWVAVRECERYRETWPEGHHAEACLRLMAGANASQGKLTRARELAAEYDQDHDGATITEQIELAWALWASEHSPKEAIPVLRDLAANHRAPLTHRVVNEQLQALVAAGFEDAALPDTVPFLQAQAISLRDARALEDAWAAFDALRRRSADDPALKRWVEDEATVFGWRTRNWPFLVEVYQEEYAQHPDGESAWNLFRALGRAGRWADAAALARVASASYGRTTWWAGKQEEIGRTFLLSKDYQEARDAFDALGSKGGWRGRRGSFYAAFAAYMGGDLPDAAARLDAILDEDRAWVTESRYWRSKVRADQGDTAGAEEDRRWVLEHDANSWYGMMVRQGQAGLPSVKPFARDGSWPGTLPPTQPAPPRQVARTGPVHSAVPTTARQSTAGAALASLRWPLPPATASAQARVEPTPPAFQCPLSPDLGHDATEVYDEAEVEERLGRYVAEHGDYWPELTLAFDLARVGLDDLSGPLFAAYYEDWKSAGRSRSAQKRDRAQAAWLKPEAWRTFAAYTRDHYHAARLWHGLSEDLADPNLSQEALRLSFPLAHGHYVWAHARAEGMDPYLVLGLMRAESTYSPLAVSRVGARGAMQIMPRTGHLLADLQHDTHFTAGDLDDPVLSVGYGITYLGLLMRRYDDVYPLAIASYNAGPHNVASWLAGTGTEMPIDAFVEHIPFRETRQYVKTVSEYYSTYLSLYPPEGARVVLPPTPKGNHPEIVDF